MTIVGPEAQISCPETQTNMPVPLDFTSSPKTDTKTSWEMGRGEEITAEQQIGSQGIDFSIRKYLEEWGLSWGGLLLIRFWPFSHLCLCPQELNFAQEHSL